MNPPPLLLNFEDSEQLISALPKGIAQNYGRNILDLSARGLPAAVSVRVLATLFGVSPKFVGSLRTRPEKYYRTYDLRVGKKVRTIDAPRVGLKIFQKWIGFHISTSIKLSDNVFGFVPKLSYINAAAKHCGSHWVFSIDIEDFFPSVRSFRVTNALVALGYRQDSAKLISDLCCKAGSLPQGAPSSPVLSNLVFKDLDSRLSTLAASSSVTYTRYADDMVFSGLGEPPNALFKTIRNTVTSDGWKLAEQKELLSIAPSRLKVHGLIVNGPYPRLTRGYKNKIRMYRHLACLYKDSVSNLPEILGHLNHAEHVDSWRQPT